ncbi:MULTISPECIES: competence protein ComK [Staphylococcus]|uniref:Competence protein ComK n=3 Tax=Staphylococcus chromogenes TaxID=46126 RepID=A0AAE5SYI3_STACR|nr:MULTISPECIES: competence protein ComK [Staphylococcus]KDP13677.1 competence transcription factor ComK [Staphylococcus chromogenes MU 970]MBP0045265.1 competence protein ComK [Staphylococcus chromogenes]MBV5137693.1 competence protein ComK [Staphylococcus chromogenes]MBV5191110.1 competence protein ComK [Staphylococcus chromogenes]MBW3131649.1 competence protein ComK [Staphylococcus chromogenes]
MTEYPNAKKYILMKGDMLLRPIDGPNGFNESTEIFRYDAPPIIVHEPPIEIIENSCKCYGEPYRLRKDQTQRISDLKSKLPINITPLFPSFYFPSHSDRTSDNSWINMHFVEQIIKLKGARTKVIFANRQSVIINASEHTIRTQFRNCITFSYLLDRRAKVLTMNPEKPIDYNHDNFNIFETLSRYAVLEKKRAKFEPAPDASKPFPNLPEL